MMTIKLCPLPVPAVGPSGVRWLQDVINLPGCVPEPQPDFGPFAFALPEETQNSTSVITIVLN